MSIRCADTSSRNVLDLELSIGAGTLCLSTNNNHVISFLGNTGLNSTLANDCSQRNGVIQRVDNVGVDTLVETTRLARDSFIRCQTNNVTSRAVRV